MTDAEIVKALERCVASEECCECPEFQNNYCMNNVMESALDLIKRLQDENKALVAGQETLQKHFIEEKNRIVEQLEKEKAEQRTWLSVAKSKETKEYFSGKLVALEDAIEIAKGCEPDDR